MTLSGAGKGDKEPASRAAGPLFGSNVLLVEDHPDVRTVLTRWLVRSGAHVRAAADAEAASLLIHAKEVELDLVISDVDLPGHSGEWVARLVRQVSPRTPVILLTGGTLDDRGPADLLMAKPVNLADLGREAELLLSIKGGD